MFISYVIIQHAFKMCILLEDQIKKSKRQICLVKDLRTGLTQKASLFKIVLRLLQKEADDTSFELFNIYCNWTVGPHRWGKVKMQLHMDISSYLPILQYGSPEHYLLRNNTYHLLKVYLWNFLTFKKNAMNSRGERFFVQTERNKSFYNSHSELLKIILYTQNNQ